MKTKKLIALVLSLVMVVGLLPTMALADESGTKGASTNTIQSSNDIQFGETGVISGYKDRF